MADIPESHEGTYPSREGEGDDGTDIAFQHELLGDDAWPPEVLEEVRRRAPYLTAEQKRLLR